MTDLNKHEYAIQYIGTNDTLDKAEMFIKAALSEIYDVEYGDAYSTEQETVPYGKVPASLLDHVKHLLPKELHFGWLTPEYIEKTADVYYVEHFDKINIKYYHRVVVDPNVVESVKWLTPSLAEPYHRLAVYGGEEDWQFHDNLISCIDIMKGVNSKCPRKLVLTSEDFKYYYEYIKYWDIDRNSSDDEDGDFLEVEVDENLKVSYLQA